MKLRKIIGEKIKFFRTRKNMNQDELADLLGTTKQTISRYENGDRQANQDILFQLANIFNVSVDDFFPKRDDVIYPSNQYNYHPITISAGLPLDVEAITNAEKITLPDNVMGKYAGHKDIIILRINGDSMDKVMPDNSLIAVKPTTLDSLKNGDIVVFSDNHDYSVKHYYRQNDTLIFKPNSNNAAHFDQTYNVDSNIVIHGKVVMYIVNLD